MIIPTTGHPTLIHTGNTRPPHARIDHHAVHRATLLATRPCGPTRRWRGLRLRTGTTLRVGP